MSTSGRCRRRLLAVFVLAAVGTLGALIGGTLPAAAQDVGVTDDAIKIGVFGPFSGPLAATWGYPITRGAYLVYEAVNEAGGIHGRKLVIVEEDDVCDPSKAVAAVKRLIHSHQVFMLHGGICSNAALAAREDIRQAKVPWMVMGATAKGVYVPIDPYIFGVIATSDILAERVFEFLMSVPDVKRVGIITHRDEWGLARYDPVITRLRNQSGVSVVADETLDRGASDSTSQTLRLKAGNPDVVFVNLYPKESAIFLRDAVKYGLDAVFVMALEDLVQIIKLGGIEKVALNMYGPTQLRYPMEDPRFSPFMERFKGRYPGISVSVFSWWAYGGAEVVVEALRRAGRNLTREKFIRELERMQGFKSDVFAGEMSFSAKDHRGHRSVTFVGYKDGKTILIGPKYAPIPK